MTDGHDSGQQPQGNGPQHREDQPWDGEQDHPAVRLPRSGAPQPGYRQPPGVAPGCPGRRKPRAARHKVLTGFLAFCGLVFVIGVATAACSSSSLSSPVAVTMTPTPKVPAAKARSTAKQTPTAALTATTAAATPSTTAPATPAAQPAAPTAPAQTTPTAQPAAPSTPVQTTPAPPPSSAPARCYPLSDEGTCYEPGEYCRDDDHGVSGVAGDGEPIICENKDGWRWEPA